MASRISVPESGLTARPARFANARTCAGRRSLARYAGVSPKRQVPTFCILLGMATGSLERVAHASQPSQPHWRASIAISTLSLFLSNYHAPCLYDPLPSVPVPVREIVGACA
jgi:hypothetical protein